LVFVYFSLPMLSCVWNLFSLVFFFCSTTDFLCCSLEMVSLLSLAFLLVQYTIEAIWSMSGLTQSTTATLLLQLNKKSRDKWITSIFIENDNNSMMVVFIKRNIE
jgi:hypothetical protein